MAVPGGVVVEGRLLTVPEPGTSSPLTITVTKGNLEYFGRLLISLPPDCQLHSRQLHGGSMTTDETRNLAVISWLKLPDIQQFDLLLDLEVSPQAVPGARALDWDFSFIRNNDRETVRSAPFHFEITPSTSGKGASRATSLDHEMSTSGNTLTGNGTTDAPKAIRTVRAMQDGRLEVQLEFENIPPGGFVKCVETLPDEIETEVSSGGGGIVQSSPSSISFVWFDYQAAGDIVYTCDAPTLHSPVDFIGTLSFIRDDSIRVIPVLNARRPEIFRSNVPDMELVADNLWYEVQVAATKNRVVTDYFTEKLNFSLPLVEENDSMWVKYLFGHFEGYKSARNCREDFNERFGFIGPFVVSKKNGKRISVQEALTTTGETWIP